MKPKIYSFDPQGKLSPRIIFMIIVAINIISFHFMITANLAWTTVDRYLTFYLVVMVFASTGLLLDLLNTLAARWFTYLGLLVIIVIIATWWNLPELNILIALPLGLLAAMVSLQASIISTLFFSILLLIFHSSVATNVESVIIYVTLIACWVMVGILTAVFLPFQNSAKLLREQLGKANQLLIEARDQRVEVERALENLANANRQLALANKKMAVLSEIAEDAQKAKTAFVANVSHEFRTPLNMITGLIDLMMRSPENYDIILSPKMREDFHVIYRNCEHLSNMVNDVLDLTRVETGRLMLYREWVNLNEIIEKAITVVRPLLEKKHLALRLDIPEDLPLVYCDRMRIQQVVLNLISNAARFTNVGEVSLKVESKNQAITVEVTDTGPGINPEDRKRIFEPFWQGHDPIWQKRGGSGIGLSLSREFITLHDGRMWFESEPGKGSSFYFTIPVTPVVDPIMNPGHFIKDDWLWRENAFLSIPSNTIENLIKPRVILFDRTETLMPRFHHYSDQIEFVNIEHLDQVATEGTAKAFIINASSIVEAWSWMEIALNNAATTPIIGCSVPGEYRRALDLGARGYLIKPIMMEDLKRVLNSINKPIQKVLVVDDDQEVLNLYKRMLESCDPGLAVSTVSCGKDALESIRCNPPDLMFLDVIMPEMSGWQVLEALNFGKKDPLFPIYFITAQDPVDQLTSKFLITTIKGGISLGKLLHVALDTASMLMEPAKEPGLTPEQYPVN